MYSRQDFTPIERSLVIIQRKTCWFVSYKWEGFTFRVVAHEDAKFLTIYCNFEVVVTFHSYFWKLQLKIGGRGWEVGPYSQL